METVVLEKPFGVLVTDDGSETVVVEKPGVVTVVEESQSTVTQESVGYLVHTETQAVGIVQGGVQGPPGVPGASTQFEYHVAGATLGGNRAVTLNSSGQLVYPDTSSPNSFVVGITTTSALAGELTTVQITGTQQEPTWNWVPGLPVFISVNGVLTQTSPTSGQVLVVGYATTPTKIHIDKQPPIFME